MEIEEKLILTTLGVLATVENLMVVLAATRNKSFRDNTHYNLVISLSVCDFIFGVILIMYGTVLMPNNDSNDGNLHLSCTILNIVSGATYQMSILQTIFISLNRYLVITENRLNHLLWNGKRKYIVFSVTWVVSIVLYVLVYYFLMHGCDLNYLLRKTIYAVVFGSFQTLVLSIAFFFYLLTLWKIYKLHNMTIIGVNSNSNNRVRKRMVNSMKVVTLILITFMISIVPSIVIGFKGVSSRLDMLLIICFTASNSAVNPFIYCTQIKKLNKEMKAMFRIHS